MMQMLILAKKLITSFFSACVETAHRQRWKTQRRDALTRSPNTQKFYSHSNNGMEKDQKEFKTYPTYGRVAESWNQ